VGEIFALVFVAGILAVVNAIAGRIVGDPTEQGVRVLLGALLIAAAAGMVALLIGLTFAGIEPVRRVPGARTATILLEWLGSSALLVLVSFAALVGGGIALVVFIVGGSAAAATVLYGVAQSFAYLFGISLRWGLVIACALLVVIAAAGGLIHDIRLEVMPPETPPKEHE
jgi:hypothetical protein